MLFNTPWDTRNDFFLLAPASAAVRPFRGKIINCDDMHSDLLAASQRLRGRIYHEDGAIQASELTVDGRYVCSHDPESWHLLSMSSAGRVLGCTRFRPHAPSVRADELGVGQAPLANCPTRGDDFRASLESELDTARSMGFSYVEVGGWALEPEVRNTAAALSSVLAIYAWSQIQGGALGISTATSRNGSASILRRLGGRSLEWGGQPLPAYYDENYKCVMEVLRFDSRHPNPRYAGMIQTLAEHLATRPVIRASRTTPAVAQKTPVAPIWANLFPQFRLADAMA